MIDCLLLYVTRDRKGLRACNEIRVAGDSIEIGRGTACQIHLPDHRVALLHAILSRADDGTLRIEAVQDALISVDGFMERSATLRPAMRIGIGPYLLAVEATANRADLVLSVAMSETTGQEVERAAAAASPPLLSGIGLAAFILLAFLILPLMARVSPAFEAWQARLPLTLTGALNPGPLSTGHAPFEAKCSACHQQAFRGVADSACTGCHKQTAAHLAADHAQKDIPGDMRCADCHPAHAGKAAAARGGSARCVDCHVKLDKEIAKARDFASAHPEFAPARAEAGFKFSHEIHLDKDGISSPDGQVTMTCHDCHRLGEAGTRFTTIEMDKTCQQSRCHRIRFGEPATGIVPHGSERAVMDRLRGAHAKWLADTPGKVVEACGPAPRAGDSARHVLDCADALARRQASFTLFSATGDQCSLCHEIEETGDTDMPWKIAPVRINRDWHPQAVFPHARHDTLGCVECHDKADSKTSEDIAMPPIGKCRECHAGAKATASRLKTNCEDCHRFHRVPGQPS